MEIPVPITHRIRAWPKELYDDADYDYRDGDDLPICGAGEWSSRTVLEEYVTCPQCKALQQGKTE